MITEDIDNYYGKEIEVPTHNLKGCLRVYCDICDTETNDFFDIYLNKMSFQPNIDVGMYTSEPEYREDYMERIQVCKKCMMKKYEDML